MPSLLSIGLGRSPFSDSALEQKSYPTDAQAVKTIVARTPAIQLLTLNSRDRFQTSTPGVSVDQPYNKFRLQRPQNIMNAFATRIGVSEVRFPYYIPNVNANNNQVWIFAYNNGGTLSLYQLTVNPGFYSGLTLANALNSIILGNATFGSYVVLQGFNLPFSPLALPSFIFNTPTSQMIYDPTTNPLFPSQLTGTNPLGGLVTEEQYNNQPTLTGLMGFAFQQVIGVGNIGSVPFVSRITTMTYTDYIDIVSDKFNQYASTRDGSSDGGFNRSLICRLYLSDEAGAGLDLTAPFTIYRQFKNPKMVEWDKMASIDWLDIAVYDEYGKLLPLPADVSLPNNQGLISGGSYPDFQITMIATQD